MPGHIPSTFSRHNSTYIRCVSGTVGVHPMQGGERYRVSATGHRSDTVDLRNLHGLVREYVEALGGLVPYMGGPKPGDYPGYRFERAAVVVNKLLEANDFPANEIEAMAGKWFKLNARKLYDEHWELGFSFYLDATGQLRTTDLARGEEAEVDLPDPPPNGKLVGSLHTHVGSIGEFSDFDMKEGQKEANRLGTPYYMFVIGPNDEGGMMMSQELFEPEV